MTDPHLLQQANDLLGDEKVFAPRVTYRPPISDRTAIALMLLISVLFHIAYWRL